ncbi:MAG: mitochondrial fission ELM1 family protein [Rhizobiales bacterium]|nr:mitochondrial fission ELM1 family protein [Hyphomicrobiales bacterium]
MAIWQGKSVWVLQGAHAGDNAQARALAHLLGVEFTLKQLHFTHFRHVPNVFLRAGLASIDHAKSASLEPPFPDLVIGVGRRTVPAAMWIKKQSGGRTKVVQMGRPRAPSAWFDLLITTPQYGLPSGPNVIELPLPLTSEKPVPEAEIALWRERFSTLPRPWIGVLVGGSRFPALIGDKGATRLGKQVSAMEGSTLVSTSPRTAPAEIEALEKALTGPHYLHRWTRGGENPHQAILALADRFVVTSDSISMLAEAWRSGKPVERFQLDRSPWAVTWQAKTGLGAFLARHGLLTPPRDPDLVKVPLAPISERDIVERIESLMPGASSPA